MAPDGSKMNLRELQEYGMEAAIAGELDLDNYTKYNEMGVPTERITEIEDLEEHWFSKVEQRYHDYGMFRYRENQALQAKMEASRHLEEQRRMEQERMEQQQIFERERQGLFGSAALKDNAIEAAANQAGVTFGGNRSVRNQPQGQRPSTTPPITLDEARPKGGSAPNTIATGKTGAYKPI